MQEPADHQSQVQAPEASNPETPKEDAPMQEAGSPANESANVQSARKLPTSKPRSIPAEQEQDSPAFPHVDCDVY